MAVTQRPESDAIRDLVTRLVEDFGQTHSPDQVTSTVDTLYHRFDGSKVRTFIPLLVEHSAREQLQSRQLQNAAS